MYFPCVNPLHIFCALHDPHPSSSIEKFKLLPSLGRKCFEASRCMFNRMHSRKVNVSTFIRNVFILL